MVDKMVFLDESLNFLFMAKVLWLCAKRLKTKNNKNRIAPMIIIKKDGLIRAEFSCVKYPVSGDEVLDEWVDSSRLVEPVLDCQSFDDSLLVDS